MTSLAETQRRFAAAIDAGGPEGEAGFADLLASTPRIGARERIGIYRRNSRGARQKPLASIFRVCREVVGDACFRGLAGRYVCEYPALGGDLNQLGETFPDLLAGIVATDPAFAEMPYLPDLARLEWLWNAAYYAPADPSFDVVAFAQAARSDSPGDIRLRLSSSARLLGCDYPVSSIWQRHRDDEPARDLPQGDGDQLLIWRPETRPLVESVSPERFELLAAIAEGDTLERLATAGRDLGVLGELVTDGLIVGIER